MFVHCAKFVSGSAFDPNFCIQYASKMFIVCRHGRDFIDEVDKILP